MGNSSISSIKRKPFQILPHEKTRLLSFKGDKRRKKAYPQKKLCFYIKEVNNRKEKNRKDFSWFFWYLPNLLVEVTWYCLHK